jgi:hypothetical protein
MVTMSNNVNLNARLEGSVASAIFRSCCAGEGMFMSHFSLLQVRVQGCVTHATCLPAVLAICAVALPVLKWPTFSCLCSSTLPSDRGILAVSDSHGMLLHQ